MPVAALVSRWAARHAARPDRGRAGLRPGTRLKEGSADGIFQLGEERFSRRIAQAIVARRHETPLETTGQLADLVRRCVPRSKAPHRPRDTHLPSPAHRRQRRTRRPPAPALAALPDCSKRAAGGHYQLSFAGRPHGWNVRSATKPYGKPSPQTARGQRGEDRRPILAPVAQSPYRPADLGASSTRRFDLVYESGFRVEGRSLKDEGMAPTRSGFVRAAPRPVSAWRMEETREIKIGMAGVAGSF